MSAARHPVEHRSRAIALEGYSALRGGTLEHPAILEIAERTGRMASQVIIRWHLQLEVIGIPKSAHADRVDPPPASPRSS
jgi:2,5-diketo-D-gluconate reductase A